MASTKKQERGLLLIGIGGGEGMGLETSCSYLSPGIPSEIYHQRQTKPTRFSFRSFRSFAMVSSCRAMRSLNSANVISFASPCRGQVSYLAFVIAIKNGNWET